jgi:hypothetical protein
MASPLASPSPAATALAGRAVLSSPCTHRHVPRAPVGVSYRVRVGVRVSYRVPGPSPTPTPNQGWAQAVPNAQSLACGPKMVTLSWPRRGFGAFLAILAIDGLAAALALAALALAADRLAALATLLAGLCRLQRRLAR